MQSSELVSSLKYVTYVVTPEEVSGHSFLKDELQILQTRILIIMYHSTLKIIDRFPLINLLA